MYIAGETTPFAMIQEGLKGMLGMVWARYRHRLPDVDMMIQFDDWMLPNMAGDLHDPTHAINEYRTLPAGLHCSQVCC